MGRRPTRNILGSRSLDDPHTDDNEREEKEKNEQNRRID
jgi:hypothetical protein